MSANNPFNPPDLWFAPAGTNHGGPFSATMVGGFTRGSITPITVSTTGGKSMFSANMLKQIQQTGRATLNHMMKQSPNIIQFDSEADMGESSAFKDLWDRIRGLTPRERNEFDIYMDDLAVYCERAKRIYDCRSPLRKATTGHTLHGEEGLSAVRIRSSDAVFYYRNDYYNDNPTCFEVAFLKIGDVSFPLITSDSDSSEDEIFNHAFAVEFNNLEEFSFQRLMEEIGEFFEDYAGEFGIKDAQP